MSKIIAVDFDGTLCVNAWPEIGAPIKETIDYLKTMKQQGARIILWTCRAGDKLNDAIKWCEEQGIVLDAVNDNLPDLTEAFGSNTRKVYADIYLDDKALPVHNLRGKGITRQRLTRLSRNERT